VTERSKTVVIGVTGSIAAYKAAEIVRLCVKRGWNTRVVMTSAATRFVGPITFQTLSRNPVGLDMFDSPEEWNPGHISIATEADAVVIAPCTANVMAKIAHGIADDLLSCIVLATKAPVIIAPAMNTDMWTNQATTENVAILERRGITVLETEEGELACGRSGSGRMLSPDRITEAISKVLDEGNSGGKRRNRR